MVLIDSIIGVGEIAIADHRGSQPSADELARIAADVRVGGMLAAKRGVVSIHVGEHESQLSLLNKVLRDFDVAANQFLPTHMNRNESLVKAGVAFTQQGGCIDFTASTTDQLIELGELRASSALALALSEGANIDQLTLSSDAQGSLPNFDQNGKLDSLQIGSISSLLDEFRRCVIEQNIALEKALKTVTINPARVLGLHHKGRINSGVDADLLLLDPDTLQLDAVMAQGQWLMLDGTRVTTTRFGE
ncbi:amidohydrolase family protein [Oceanicoccus sp. KOV_DT_Chl]|uniref:amidohydrolase family protein n=1 Tax=Oceanicoccus sp. KOV_DT_Chl TaxID=1904639 RepID=UPI001F3A9220|nr:amidohydrolase family protein [Oceanicoccus sp. KOV_DT_Chl]